MKIDVFEKMKNKGYEIPMCPMPYNLILDPLMEQGFGMILKQGPRTLLKLKGETYAKGSYTTASDPAYGLEKETTFYNDTFPKCEIFKFFRGFIETESTAIINAVNRSLDELPTNNR